MTIESRLLVSIEHLKRTLSFFVHSKNPILSTPNPFPMLSRQKIPLNSMKYTIFTILVFQHKLIQWSTFRMKMTKLKLALKVKNGPIRTPRLVPCKLDYRKSKNTKKCKFSPITKNGPMVNIPMGGVWFFEAIRPRSLTLVLKKKLSKLTTCSL